MSDDPKRQAGWGKAVREERRRKRQETGPPPDVNDSLKYKPKSKKRYPALAVGSLPNNPFGGAGPERREKVPLATAVSSGDDDEGEPPIIHDLTRADDMFDAAGPPRGATPAHAKKASSSCVHACLVDLFQHQGLNKAIPKGQLGAAILHCSSDSSFSLLLYAPTSKRHELELDVVPSFSFTVLPGLFATFTDTVTNSYWSVKFKQQKALSDFARHIALVKAYRLKHHFKQGGTARVIEQDLVRGSTESRELRKGDQVKLKITICALDPSGLKVGKPLGDKVVKVILGEEDTLAVIEQGVLGLSRKGSRFLVVPPELVTDTSKWGLPLPSGEPLIIEVAVSSIRDKKQKKKRIKGPAPPLEDDGDDDDEAGRMQAAIALQEQEERKEAGNKDKSKKKKKKKKKDKKQQAEAAIDPAQVLLEQQQAAEAKQKAALAAQEVEDSFSDEETSDSEVEVPLQITMLPTPGASLPPASGLPALPTSTLPRALPAAGSTLPYAQPPAFYGQMPSAAPYGGGSTYNPYMGQPLPGMTGMGGQIGGFPGLRSNLPYSLPQASALPQHPQMQTQTQTPLPTQPQTQTQVDAPVAEEGAGVGGKQVIKETKLQKKASKKKQEQAREEEEVEEEEEEEEDQLIRLLTKLGLEEFERNFTKQCVIYADLPLLSESEMAKLVPKIGPRRRLTTELRKLQFGKQAQVKSSRKGGRRQKEDAFEMELDAGDIFADTHTAPGASGSSERELHDAYVRGQKAAVALAKDKMDHFKKAAKLKFAEMQETVDACESKATRHDAAAAKAKEIVMQLREQLQQAREETQKAREGTQKERKQRDKMQVKSRQYVAQMRELRASVESGSFLRKEIKGVMDMLYSEFSAKVQDDDVYDGAQVSSALRKAIKVVTTTYVGSGPKLKATAKHDTDDSDDGADVRRSKKVDLARRNKRAKAKKVRERLKKSKVREKERARAKKEVSAADSDDEDESSEDDLSLSPSELSDSV